MNVVATSGNWLFMLSNLTESNEVNKVSNDTTVHRLHSFGRPMFYCVGVVEPDVFQERVKKRYGQNTSSPVYCYARKVPDPSGRYDHLIERCEKHRKGAFRATFAEGVS